MTALVADGSGGHPDVLAAQVICGAAVSGARVLMLLPQARDDDEVWRRMITLLADGDPRSAARALGHLPISLHTSGTGWDRVRGAELIYTPGVQIRELRRLRDQTNAPILVTNKGIDRQSVNCSIEILRVSDDAVLLDSEGVKVSVVYDPSGPIYRPA
ncbi:hypothetical protein [Streptomyces cucumeris]|uniref:hypothetical protein n=1 Tax=Streptomyces cucumeris TaxID=2962890 RepID=UPI0020C8F81F|nr:hypothetical protein [Streptomyces sp. NEAU-Y11]MCP9209642.1 hypothetical protein [Streptomyces sp. NEAU-Y11]